MTITLTKTKAAIAVVVVALLVPATAFAANSFTDVPAEKFYAGPVDWAFNNDITTGKTATSFAPEDNVTRGESVTFLKRYNDNIVEPGDEANAAAAAAAQADADAAQAGADANAVDIAALQSEATSHFVIATGDGTLINTSYPGATTSKIQEGAYLVTFPGQAIFQRTPGDIYCATQSTTIEDTPAGSAVTFNDDLGAPDNQVIVFTFLPDGTLDDTAFSLTITC